MSILEQKYVFNSRTPSDINEHLQFKVVYFTAINLLQLPFYLQDVKWKDKMNEKQFLLLQYLK